MLPRLRTSLTYANVMATIAVFAAIGGGALAIGAIPDRQGKIKACYVKSGETKGQVRLLVSGARCRKGEIRVSWNQRGRQGATGRAGTDAQFNGVAAGGDLAGTYPSPTLAPLEAETAVRPAPASANCGGSAPATGEFCALGANGWIWQNYGGAYAPAGFFKDRSGVVHLRGSVQETGPGATPIFVLPSGYRPGSTRVFVVRDDSGPNPPFNYVEISADGRVIKPSPSSTSYLSLDGIDFRAEQ